MSWNTTTDPDLAEGRSVLLDYPERFDGVALISGGEHAWRDTLCGDNYVTVFETAVL